MAIRTSTCLLLSRARSFLQAIDTCRNDIYIYIYSLQSQLERAARIAFEVVLLKVVDEVVRAVVLEDY